MNKTASAWRPTTIRRFVKAFPTSASTVIVETDAGQGYLKALGSREGPHILACEWLGTSLAKWFHLPTFDFAIIQVTEMDEIPFHDGGKAEPGPAFITRKESGEPWGGGESQLDRIANPADISRLVVFDTWTLNCDRHSWPEHASTRKARVNRDNVFLSEEARDGMLLLRAMDHTHCFTCGREPARKDAHIDRIRHPSVFGLFPEFRKRLQRDEVTKAAKALTTLDRSEVVRITAEIPKEWGVGGQALDALSDLVVERAKFVAETIEEKLWPRGEQGAFVFEDDDQKEEAP